MPIIKELYNKSHKPENHQASSSALKEKQLIKMLNEDKNEPWFPNEEH
jgi:hypothetical protein